MAVVHGATYTQNYPLVLALPNGTVIISRSSKLYQNLNSKVIFLKKLFIVLFNLVTHWKIIARK